MILLQASHATQIPAGEAGGWYQLLPKGAIPSRDGRGPWKLTQPETVLAAFARMQIDLPVDYDHQALEAANKQGPVPAAGWIKELAAREDGIWARIEWTERAAACLEAKEYRYLSPVFLYDKTGEVKAITMAALTNTPNLFLQAAASRQGDAMDELLERLRYLLNLPLTTTPEELVTHLDKLKVMIAGSETATAAASALRQALNLGEDAGVGDLLTAANARLAAPPDPAQWVPMETYQQAANSLHQLQEDQRAADATGLVQAAMAAGKVTPAQEAWALGYARADLDGFKAFVEKAPVLVQAANRQGQPPSTVTPRTTLTEDQQLVAAACGISPEDYLKTLNAEKE